MASVTPVARKNGFAWRVQARDANDKMRQETFFGEDAVEVEKAARAFGKLVDRVGITEASRIRDARTGAAARGVPTLAEWIDTYLDKSTGILRGVTDGTRAGYRSYADGWIVPRLGEMPVDAIDEDAVSEWLTWMEAQPSKRRPGQPTATKTIKNRHAFLSAVLGAAAKKGHRTGNPAEGAKFARVRRPKIVFLTQSEFVTLLAFIPKEWRPLVTWLAGTGMRWGEATALTWGDIDAGARPSLAHVDKAWQKPETGVGRVLGPPKTDAGERSVSVPDSLLGETGASAAGDVLVFRASRGGAIWPGPFHDRVWAPAVAKANDAETCEKLGLTPIGKKPRIHDLRHSHASWLIAAGRPLPYIQRRLGHEKITTTVDTYGHLLPDAQQGDADAVEAALSGVLPQLDEARTPRQIEN